MSLCGIMRRACCTFMLLFANFSILVVPSALGSGGEGEKSKGGGKGGGHGSGEATPAEAPKASQGYVHHWIKMPPFAAASILGLDSQEVKSQPGRVLVLFFLASWCEPCQEIIGEVRRLEKRYQGLAADFVYVFAHDTRDDAAGFMREHGMNQGLLANHDLLKEYHNPELPTVYVGDRDGFLLTRYIKVNSANLTDLNNLLLKLTAY